MLVMSESLVFPPGTKARIETLEGPDLPPLAVELVLHDAVGLQVRLPAGQSLEDDMPVHVEVQDDAGLYTFATVVLGRDRRDPRLVSLAPPADIELTQRRSYTRVPDTLPVSVIIRDGGRISSVSSLTIDVSVGGLSLTAPQPVAGSVTVVLTVPDPNRPLPSRIRLDGEVRRCVPQGNAYRVAVAFAELAPDEEQVLSQYLFKRMREIRRAKVGPRR